MYEVRIRLRRYYRRVKAAEVFRLVVCYRIENCQKVLNTWSRGTDMNLTFKV